MVKTFVLLEKKMRSVLFDIVNQQYTGEKIRRYDNIIERLHYLESDEYCQLYEDDSGLYCDTPIFACKFAQKDEFRHHLALANEDGKLVIVDVKKKDKRVGIWAHHNAVFDVAWTHKAMKLTSASGDHTAKLFDVTNSDIREIRVFYGHSRSVKTVSYRKDDPNVFATGGRDGNVMIWDVRTNDHCLISKPDCQIKNAHIAQVPPIKYLKRNQHKTSLLSSGTNSVTSLVFRDDHNLISCAAGDGLLKIWDLRKTFHTYKDKSTPKCMIEYPGEKARNGFSNLIIDRGYTKLYANCLDNTIYCYNALTFDSNPVMKYRGHQNNTFYVKSSLSRDGEYLISGSSDENAYIWKTNSSMPIIKLPGHKAEVTCVAWCQDTCPLVVTCSDDMKHKIWRVDPTEMSNDWSHLCKGKAEVLDSLHTQEKQRLKRPNYDDDKSQVCKRFKREYGECLEVRSENISCEDCSETRKDNKMNLNRKTNDPNVQEVHNFSLSNSTYQNIGKENYLKLGTNQTSIESLPNFNVDGIAPHVNQSPIKMKDPDWLTRMRSEMICKKRILETCNHSSIVKSSPSSSMNSKRNNVECRQTSLLRFFKVKNSKSDNTVPFVKPSNCSFMSSLQPTK